MKTTLEDLILKDPLEQTEHINNMTKEDLIECLKDNLQHLMDWDQLLDDVSDEKIQEYKNILIDALNHKEEGEDDDAIKVENSEKEQEKSLKSSAVNLPGPEVEDLKPIVNNDLQISKIISSSLETNKNTEQITLPPQPEIVDIPDVQIIENVTVPKTDIPIITVYDDDDYGDMSSNVHSKFEMDDTEISSCVENYVDDINQKIKSWIKMAEPEEGELHSIIPEGGEIPENEEEEEYNGYDDDYFSDYNDDEHSDTDLVDEDLDRADEYCGAGLLNSQIRLPCINDSDFKADSCFIKMFTVKNGSNYERDNFQVKCNLCGGEFIANKLDLGVHVRGSTHRTNLANLSLKIIGIQANLVRSLDVDDDESFISSSESQIIIEVTQEDDELHAGQELNEQEEFAEIMREIRQDEMAETHPYENAQESSESSLIFEDIDNELNGEEVYPNYREIIQVQLTQDISDKKREDNNGSKQPKTTSRILPLMSVPLPEVHSSSRSSRKASSKDKTQDDNVSSSSRLKSKIVIKNDAALGNYKDLNIIVGKERVVCLKERSRVESKARLSPSFMKRRRYQSRKSRSQSPRREIKRRKSSSKDSKRESSSHTIRRKEDRKDLRLELPAHKHKSTSDNHKEKEKSSSDSRKNSSTPQSSSSNSKNSKSRRKETSPKDSPRSSSTHKSSSSNHKTKLKEKSSSDSKQESSRQKSSSSSVHKSRRKSKSPNSSKRSSAQKLSPNRHNSRSEKSSKESKQESSRDKSPSADRHKIKTEKSPNESKRSSSTHKSSPGRQRCSSREKEVSSIKKVQEFPRPVPPIPNINKTKDVWKMGRSKQESIDIFQVKLALQANGKWNDDMDLRWKLMERDEKSLNHLCKRKTEEMEKKPEEHPLYETEWEKFWNRRHSQIVLACGEEYAESCDYTSEWKIEWSIFSAQLVRKHFEEKLQELREKYGMDLNTLKALNAQKEVVVVPQQISIQQNIIPQPHIIIHQRIVPPPPILHPNRHQQVPKQIIVPPPILHSNRVQQVLRERIVPPPPILYPNRHQQVPQQQQIRQQFNQGPPNLYQAPLLRPQLPNFDGPHPKFYPNLPNLPHINYNNHQTQAFAGEPLHMTNHPVNPISPIMDAPILIARDRHRMGQ